MTVFMGSWQRPDAYHRIATILACASIVVTAVYILRATGQAVMGPIKNESYLKLNDASIQEKSASVLLTAGILAIGIAPFWLVDLISPDTQIIIENLFKNSTGY